MGKITSALLCLALVFALPADARIKRDPKAVDAFKWENPCPSTGKARGPCKGFVVDHLLPLCAGGLDVPANMAWSELATSKRKDREEIGLCVRIRQGLVAASSDRADLCPVVKREQWPLLTAALCVDGTRAVGSN